MAGRWVEVPAAADLQVGEGCECVVEGRVIALFRLESERFAAIDGTCPHHGGPLGQGRLEGNQVVCPWHGLRVNVESGEYCLAAADTLPTFPLRFQEGRWEIKVESSE